MAASRPAPETQDAPERLLERFLAGDGDAFERLVERYEARLYGFIERMIGDGHTAEDVFQQTFVKVALNAAAFDGRASFSTWLFRIARNTALDELRRRSRDRIVYSPGGADLDDRPDRTVGTPLEKMTREEMAAEIREALEAIPFEQREAFLLKEEGELDFAEIGEVLGCGRETAKSRFRLAVGKLRQALGVEGGRG